MITADQLKDVMDRADALHHYLMVKSVQELFTIRNAHKHWGFQRKGEE